MHSPARTSHAQTNPQTRHPATHFLSLLSSLCSLLNPMRWESVESHGCVYAIEGDGEEEAAQAGLHQSALRKRKLLV